MNFTDWPWHYWAQRRGDGLALQFGHGGVTWRELCTQIDSLAGGFYSQGVREGDGVALRGKNSRELLLAYLALMQCGARILPLNPQLPESMLAALLPGLSLTFSVTSPGEQPLPGLVPLMLQSASPWQVGWQEDRLVSMILTSGSMGLPKAAVHHARAHLACAAGVVAALTYGEQDCWLLSLPLYHVSGQGILWRWLSVGGRMALPGERGLAEALQGCSHASLVPTQLWRLLDATMPTSLRQVLLGGAAIPVTLTRQAQARGIDCWCGYGLTELASTLCAKRADGAADVGEALGNHQIKIVAGEVWVKADSLASGYWQAGKLRPLVDSDGWFATRDLGRLEKQRLTLIGRRDNLFFSGGEGIQPEQVERVIAQHPTVQQVFIVPLANVEFGHRPVAVVSLGAGGEPATIHAWLDDKIPRYQKPIRWLTLPQEWTARGIKISRHQLTAWVAEQLSPEPTGH